MSHTEKGLTRAWVVVGLFVFAIAIFAVMKTKGQGANPTGNGPTEQWEYLTLAGPTTGLNPAPDVSMRKEPNAGFAREAFALERHLDKLGANGWELIAVAGSPNDPAYYFKRRR